MVIDSESIFYQSVLIVKPTLQISQLTVLQLQSKKIVSEFVTGLGDTFNDHRAIVGTSKGRYQAPDLADARVITPVSVIKNDSKMALGSRN